ncbi:hypothetical protein BC332_29456 [Capsicum chinense]|nr:hypothetical protein BC332_29456 [Capsicum chinense]
MQPPHVIEPSFPSVNLLSLWLDLVPVTSKHRVNSEVLQYFHQTSYVIVPVHPLSLGHTNAYAATPPRSCLRPSLLPCCAMPSPAPHQCRCHDSAMLYYCCTHALAGVMRLSLSQVSKIQELQPLRNTWVGGFPAESMADSISPVEYQTYRQREFRAFGFGNARHGQGPGSGRDRYLLSWQGGWEKNVTIEDAAQRKTIEEAEVRREVECELGTWYFENNAGDTAYEGRMFPLFVKEDLDECGRSKKTMPKWMDERSIRSLSNSSHITKQADQRGTYLQWKNNYSSLGM